MIIEETYRLLNSKYADKFENLLINDIRIGTFLSAIKLSDGSDGVASTNYLNSSKAYSKERYFGDFSPGKIIGQNVMDLFGNNVDFKFQDSLRNAALNAISSSILSSSNYKIISDADPIDYLDLSGSKNITIVGAFLSYINKLADSDHKLQVLELNENALSGDLKKYYVPAANYKNVIPNSDIVLITGLSLVNNTIDDLLSEIGPETQVVITGPSSSLIPDVLFANKVNIIGATKITNTEILFDIVSQGGMGYHLFKYCAQKICIFNEQ